MELKLGKTYRCLNGCKLRVEGIDGNSVAYCHIDNGQSRKMRFNVKTGKSLDVVGNGYDVIGEAAAGPSELMFAFRVPSPQYSRIVSETELRRHIEDTKRNNFTHDAPEILALAAERMIEMAKAPAPKPPPLKLDPSMSIRAQLAGLLEEIGLEPDRFLASRPYNSPFNSGLETKPMCPTAPTSKQVADQAARELVQMMQDDLGIKVPAVLFRLWLVERWDQVTKLAHKIHGSAG